MLMFVVVSVSVSSKGNFMSAYGWKITGPVLTNGLFLVFMQLMEMRITKVLWLFRAGRRHNVLFRQQDNKMQKYWGF